jgi:hypothetical protein
MAGSEHFMFAKETTFGTWTTPNKALPVRTVALTGGQPLMIPDETGGGRGQRPGSPGEISATGDVTTLLHPTVLPFLLRSVFATRATSAAGTGFRNKLLIDDDISFDTFSVQKRYRADLAESLRGVKMTGFTIGARAREFATCTLNFAGKDSTITPGGTWSDGTSAPVVVDPVPYEATYVEPFKFYQGVIRLGGSVTLTAGELVVTGGTPRNDLDNVEIAFNFNVGTDAYGINLGDRTVQSLDEGRREITVRFDPNFNNSGAEFYNAWKNGARAIVELFFQGPIYNASSRYELKLTLPWVVYSNGAVPELNAAYGLKRHTVEGSAFVDPTTDVDVGLVIQSPEDLST